jgi:hypothetical protein
MGDSVKKYKESKEVKITPESYPNYTVVEPKDKHVQSVKNKFEQRSQTGIKKYNTTLEREDLNLQEWLNHLQEELMDATLYIERLKSEVGNKLR